MMLCVAPFLSGTAAFACDTGAAGAPVSGSRASLPRDQAIASGSVVAAHYTDLTDRYAHGVLGDALEPTTLVVQTVGSAETCARTISLTLDETHVFEDVAPRLVDLDGDLSHEVVVVRSHREYGAQLAVYGLGPGQAKLELRAATPYIGRRNRWLAPIGAADMDGDGAVEIAYIDRPHLAKRLRVWRFQEDELSHVADLGGLTNHRIGEPDIGGGLRECESNVEMITASGDWSRIMATRLKNGQLKTRDMGPHRGRASLRRAMLCD